MPVEQAQQLAQRSRELPAAAGQHVFQRGFVGGPAVLQVGQMLLLFCQLLAQLLDLSVCLQQLFGALP